MGHDSIIISIAKTAHNLIPLDFCGFFEPHFQSINKFKIVKAREEETFSIKLILNELNPQFKVDTYLIKMDFGYFDFSDRFRYLTEGTEEFVLIKEEDVSDLINLHSGFEVGYLPLHVRKN